MTICTCLVGYVSHVGGVMLDCFFIMFQRFFKVLILICRVPKFLFLHSLLKKELWSTWLFKNIYRKGELLRLDREFLNLIYQSFIFWKIFFFRRRWLGLFGFGRRRRRRSGLFFFHLRQVQSQQHGKCGHHPGILQLPVKQGDVLLIQHVSTH